ncbi:MAG: hypothetical protein ACOC3F_01820, partial [Desulfosudaceae bacterium]
MNRDDIIRTIADLLIKGDIMPWNAEEAAREEGLPSPDNLTAAVEARRLFVEKKCGHRFCHLVMPEHPYHVAYQCPHDGTLWTLAVGDTNTNCTLCGTALEMLPENERHQPLVNNYIGGVEDYCSYSGQVTVTGDVDKTFQILLCWGPGVGHLGIGVGCYKLNQYGPVEVKVADWGRAARNLSFVFDTEAERARARQLIEKKLPDIIPRITDKHLAD